jgi:hypothetical protein
MRRGRGNPGRPGLAQRLAFAPGRDSPGYFEREFGITDGLCRKVLAEALAKGGDYSDLYFEHTISNFLILQDGKVNRAVSDIAFPLSAWTVSVLPISDIDFDSCI